MPTKEQIDNANFGILPNDYKDAIVADFHKKIFLWAPQKYRFGKPYKGYTYSAWGFVRFGYLVPVDVSVKSSFFTGFADTKYCTYFFSGDNERYYFLGCVGQSGIYYGRLEDTSVEKPSKIIPKDNDSVQKVNGAIIQLKGSGLKTTGLFTTNGPWEIQWDAKGDYFSAIIFNADGSLIDVAANQEGSGKSSSYQSNGGRYYIKVSAVGNWEIVVVEVKEKLDVKSSK